MSHVLCEFFVCSSAVGKVPLTCLERFPPLFLRGFLLVVVTGSGSAPGLGAFEGTELVSQTKGMSRPARFF